VAYVRGLCPCAGGEKGGTSEWNENIVVVINPNSDVEIATKLVIETDEGQKGVQDSRDLEKCHPPPPFGAIPFPVS
jgi:RNA polymerase subunit RPABC4/transcription elongation factor Spt4